MFARNGIFLLAVLVGASAFAQETTRRNVLLGGVPGFVLRGGGIAAGVDLNFLTQQYYQSGYGAGFSAAPYITVSRASTGTNLLPTSASGFAYSTFGNNVPRITPGSGLLVEEARTNSLLNSAAPATQTTASLGTNTYTLWVNGSGSATSSAGTATGSGFGAATNGSANTFTLTVAGTVVVTISGSLNAFQLEAGSFGTSLIVTGGSTATRAGDSVTLTKLPSFGTSYSMFAKFTPNAPTSYGANQVSLVISDGTSGNEALLIRSITNGNSDFFGQSGGANYANISGAPVLVQNVSASMAVRLAPLDQALYAAGTLVGVASSGSPAGTSNVTIGSNFNGTAQIDGYIERVAIWPRSGVPNSGLGTLTK